MGREMLKREMLLSVGSTALICCMILSTAQQHSSATTNVYKSQQAAQAHRMDQLDATVAALTKVINDHAAADAEGFRLQRLDIDSIAERVSKLNVQQRSVSELVQQQLKMSERQSELSIQTKQELASQLEKLGTAQASAANFESQLESIGVMMDSSLRSQKAHTTTVLKRTLKYLKAHTKSQTNTSLERLADVEENQISPEYNLDTKYNHDLQKSDDSMQVNFASSRRTWKNRAPILSVFDGETSDQVYTEHEMACNLFTSLFETDFV